MNERHPATFSRQHFPDRLYAGAAAVCQVPTVNLALIVVLLIHSTTGS